MSISSIFLDIVYPRDNICLFCGQNLLFSEIKGLCSSCLEKIYFLEEFCPVCGRGVTDDNTVCDYCREKKWYFKNARAIAEYRGLMKELIFYLKYFNKKELANPLGNILGIYFDHYYGEVDINYIIPIPLHDKKEELRGYNQTALLSIKLGEYTGIPVLSNYLIRKKETPPLYNFGWMEREEVIRDVFALSDKGDDLKGKNVLLIDDIFTSGSTVNEAARIMYNRAGVKNVYVLTLATYSILE